MLKADLIRPRITVGENSIAPRLLEADYFWLAVATDLLRLFKQHVGQSRARLDESLRDYEGDRLDYPIIRGLTAVLFNRAAFDNQPPVVPAELRLKLFAKGPISHQTDLFNTQTRQQRIQEAAEAFQITPALVESAVFADLEEEQILQNLGDPLTPKELIERYNLEVCRGLLYWAREMRIHVADNYRTVFKYIKLMRLMHDIAPAETGYNITLYGPISPFIKSTIRYGLQFARFMPALLLCDTWQMQADVRLPGHEKFLLYRLNDQTELRSYFKESGGFASKLEASFAAEFEEKYSRAERIWELAYEDEIIPVGDSVMIPDFSFKHRKNGRKALLEIVGFWHPNYLRRKLEKIRLAGRSDLIVLVYESSNVAEGAFEAASAGEVLMFKDKPVLKEVIAAVERSAR